MMNAQNHRLAFPQQHAMQTSKNDLLDLLALSRPTENCLESLFGSTSTNDNRVHHYHHSDVASTVLFAKAALEKHRIAIAEEEECLLRRIAELRTLQLHGQESLSGLDTGIRRALFARAHRCILGAGEETNSSLLHSPGKSKSSTPGYDGLGGISTLRTNTLSRTGTTLSSMFSRHPVTQNPWNHSHDHLTNDYKATITTSTPVDPSIVPICANALGTKGALAAEDTKKSASPSFLIDDHSNPSVAVGDTGLQAEQDFGDEQDVCSSSDLPPDGKRSLLRREERVRRRNGREAAPKRWEISVSFPCKLFHLLREAEEEGHEDVASFLPCGTAFRVHKPTAFAQDLMPKYFKTNRISSFQKQLNLYGFQKIKSGSSMGAIYHESFQRDDQRLLAKIQRKRQHAPKGTKDKEKS